MSLDPKTPRRPAELPRDKPPIDRGEHANIDRPGAHMHPRAREGRTLSRSEGWMPYLQSRRAWN